MGNRTQQFNGYQNNIRMGSMTPNRFTAAEILAAKRQNENIDARMEDTILSGNFDHFCYNWHFCSDAKNLHLY